MAAICPCCRRALPEGYADHTAIVVHMRVGRRQGAILNKLARSFGSFVPLPRIIEAAWAEDADGGPLGADDTVRAIVHVLRARLRPHGLAIESAQGSGYRLIWDHAEAA